MSAGRDGVGLRRVQVELADGFNFSGVVQREYRDSRGRRRIVVEDTRGEERDVGLWRPSVSITGATVGGLDESDGRATVSDGSKSLQEQLRAAYRDSQGGGSA